MTRICYRCKKEKELTSKFFVKESSRLHGLSYDCRLCYNERKRLRNKITKRSQKVWANMNQTQRQKRYEGSRAYFKTPRGKALSLLKSCQSADKKKGHECDLTKEWLLSYIVGQPCTYCGDSQNSTGCDRVINSIGHTKANVVPCCKTCNLVRGNRFSIQEMRLIGITIQSIKNSRKDIPHFELTGNVSLQMLRNLYKPGDLSGCWHEVQARI